MAAVAAGPSRSGRLTANAMTGFAGMRAQSHRPDADGDVHRDRHRGSLCEARPLHALFPDVLKQGFAVFLVLVARYIVVHETLMRSSMKITILCRDPLGGRCSLYFGYAQAIASHLGASVEVLYPTADAEIQAPALLILGKAVTPSDGVIVSPADVADALAGREGSRQGLLEALEAAEAKLFER